MLGQVEHVLCDLDVLDVVKIFGGVAHLVGIAEQHAISPLSRASRSVEGFPW